MFLMGQLLWLLNIISHNTKNILTTNNFHFPLIRYQQRYRDSLVPLFHVFNLEVRFTYFKTTECRAWVVATVMTVNGVGLNKQLTGWLSRAPPRTTWSHAIVCLIVDRTKQRRQLNGHKLPPLLLKHLHVCSTNGVS